MSEADKPNQNQFWVCVVGAFILISIIALENWYIKTHKQDIIVTETKSENDNARYEANEIEYQTLVDSLLTANDSLVKVSHQKQVSHEKRKTHIISLHPDVRRTELFRTADSLAEHRYRLVN